MIIEPGKFYKTRDGRKARIYAVDGALPFLIHGATLGSVKWIFCEWTMNGAAWASGEEHPSDIVSEWTEEPQLEKKKMYSAVSNNMGQLIKGDFLFGSVSGLFEILPHAVGYIEVDVVRLYSSVEGHAKER